MENEAGRQSKKIGLIGELRRRRVPETVIFYAAGSWALIEIAATLFPIFGFPPLAIKIFLVALIVAFPIVIALSWTFDISLKGLVRTGQSESRPAPIDFSQVPQSSIAVLPFVNMSSGNDNEYFGDGLAEELLNLLAKHPDLKVAARTSSFAFRGKDQDIRQLGSLLGVHHVLEGSVRQAGQRLRITAQLIEAPTGYHLWSDTFDRDLDDIFVIQDEIAHAICDALHLAMRGKARAERNADELPTENIEAYQYFLRANYLYQRRGAEALTGAISALNQAIELDPEYAQAYSLLAAAEAILHEYKQEHREDAFIRAEAHARKAISLDPALGEAHAVLGYMDLRLWRWESCEMHFERALELDSTLPTPHQWYSNLLNDLGRHDDAHREAMRAHSLDPLSPSANNVLAFTALFRADDASAAKHVGITRQYGLGGGIPDRIDFI
ncbi:MAG: hypothetical protein KJO35_05300, partial [Gammaproteobacteria bacterium]|nr:hypothetical protein [Gammaproteobacteria bacterium]